MKLTEFMWLDIHDLEMELDKFQSSIVSKNKFENLISEVEGKISESIADINDPTLKYHIKRRGLFTNQSMMILANAILIRSLVPHICMKNFFPR